MASPRSGASFTVLFSDLVGSTELSSRLDPEDLRDVIGAYCRCVADTVARFDGFVARYMGDGALVYFGYPHAHEDNAERALRAALAIISNIGKLDVRHERLSTRIGIATGLVVVGELANVVPRESVPHSGKRRPGRATAGARRAGHHRDRRQHPAPCRRRVRVPRSRAWQHSKASKPPFGRGKSSARNESIAPRRFTGNLLPASMARESAVSPSCRTGTGAGLLHDRWQEVTEGQGRVVLLSGDAGVGKSRLVQMLLAIVGTGASRKDRDPVLGTLGQQSVVSNHSSFRGALGWSEDDPDETRLEKLEAFCTLHRISSTEACRCWHRAIARGVKALSSSTDEPGTPEAANLADAAEVVLAFAAEAPVCWWSRTCTGPMPRPWS